MEQEYARALYDGRIMVGVACEADDSRSWGSFAGGMCTVTQIFGVVMRCSVVVINAGGWGLESLCFPSF
jgi:hypothetical protein